MDDTTNMGSGAANTSLVTATQQISAAISLLNKTINAGQPNGITVTITTAKLTTGGTNGQMVFVKGILTGSTAAT